MTSFIVAAILSEFALADKLVHGPGLGSEVGFPSLRHHNHSRPQEFEAVSGQTVVGLISEAKVDIVQSFTAGVL